MCHTYPQITCCQHLVRCGITQMANIIIIMNVFDSTLLTVAGCGAETKRRDIGSCYRGIWLGFNASNRGCCQFGAKWARREMWPVEHR